MRRLHQKFVNEYIKTYLTGPPNGTQAAINAGYKETTAAVQASRLLKRDDINAAIDAKLAENEPKSEVSQDALVCGLKEIAFSKTAADRDKLRALELLGKRQGMFTDKVAPTTTVRDAIPEEELRELREIVTERYVRKSGVINSEQAARELARQRERESRGGHQSTHDEPDPQAA